MLEIYIDDATLKELCDLSNFIIISSYYGNNRDYDFVSLIRNNWSQFRILHHLKTLDVRTDDATKNNC